MSSPKIPSYYRYGEEDRVESADLVHCQAIFSRISEQGWEIRPHRHKQLYQLFIVEEGKLETVLETQKITLFGPCVLVVPAGCVHGFGYGEGVRGRMISVSDGFLRGAMESNAGAGRPETSQVMAFHDRGESFAEIATLFSAVELEVSRRGPGFMQALAALMQLMFVHLGRGVSLEETARAPNDQVECFDRFRDLVDRELRSHLPVTKYCSELGVGERRLNRVCRALSGESPLGYMHRQLVEEAKRYLVHTAMPVSSVGYELGFTDAAYFSRFFKKHTGLSPSRFAAQHRG